ncbi:MAG: signal peptide peptidase SppA, type [bacterium]|nr:signal peptide peptidase SppA, type [bacterium]
MRKASLLIVLLWSAAARAQRPLPVGEPPTPGVYNPTIGLAGDADASAVEKNAASLGFLPSWSGVYLHSELDPAQTVGGRGDGFFVATPLPYLSAIVLGAGVQLLRPPSSFPFPNEQKFSLALGVRVHPGIALGLSYAHVWADRGPVASGIDTLDVALALRPARWLAAALVVHDLPSPAVQQFPLQRVWEPELAVRPWKTSIVELAVGARFGERRGDVDPHFRLWLVPTAGITVKADVEWKRDVNLDGSAENDIRVGLGLAVDLEHVGVQGFGLFGTDSGVARAHGFTLAARISGDRYPAVWRGPQHLVRIDLSQLGERKLAHLVAWMRRSERDRDVAGVVFVLGALEGSWATAEELRAAIVRLRRARKHVYVYVAETNTRGYYVASAAERIYQDPAGGLRLLGLSSTTLFFRGLGDLIGVRADFVKIAEYKSAPEQYTRTESTPAARAQREAFVGDVWAHLVGGIAASRHVSLEAARAWIDRGPYTADEAKAAGLVDELRHGDEVEAAIAERLGRPVALKNAPRSPERENDWERPAVAVLFVDGDIIDGKSATIPLLGMKFAGMQTLMAAIQRARDDSRVRAIVVRVDSPGGSALASDVIARELERTAEVKPVICSLGDVAASGGYFIAAACSRVYAAPSTLTGSIGIFTGKFDVSGLAAKLGISLESYERGAHAGIDSLYRSYTDEERALILTKLRYFYNRFIAQVARGRHMKPGDVDAIARGHIWSGDAALARGLVDEFGGLMDAVAEAKRRAGLDENDRVTLQETPAEPTLLGQLLALFGIGGGERAATRSDGDLLQRIVAPALRGLPGSLLVEPNVPQARLEFDVSDE